MTVTLELLARGPSRPDLTEDLIAEESTVSEVLARWSIRPPVTVAGAADLASDAGVPADLTETAAVLASGSAALVDVAPGMAGPGPEEDHLVDLLAVAAHSGVGFGSGLVARCADIEQVWALLSGAVAVLTGDDVRLALAHPEPARILGLPRSAREAIRDVVTCIVVPEGQATTTATAIMMTAANSSQA